MAVIYDNYRSWFNYYVRDSSGTVISNPMNLQLAFRDDEAGYAKFTERLRGIEQRWYEVCKRHGYAPRNYIVDPIP